MEKDEGRGVASFLPFPGLYDSPGGQEGSPDAACISDIKGQKHYRRETLDYYWNLHCKSLERFRSQKEKNRAAKYKRSHDLVKTWGGDYVVVNKQNRESVRQNELLKVYSGLLLVRKTEKKKEEDEHKERMKEGFVKYDLKERMVEETTEDESKIKRMGGKKQRIKTFSKRSRLNMMKHLGMMINRPEFWFDLTYPDDVLEGLTQEQIKMKSSEDMHQLKRWMERDGIKGHGAWKREWKKRKSGKLKGIYAPHFHNVEWIEDADDKKYLQTYYRIAEKWLQIIGTKGEYELAARRVLYHKDSFRFIKSQKQMRKYMQKYVTKAEEYISDESIGRSWGLIGDPIDKNPEEIEVENNELILLKRMLRKLCKGINKKVKYGLNFCLSHEWTQFFVLMEKQTVYTMLEHIRSGTLVKSVPF